MIGKHKIVALCLSQVHEKISNALIAALNERLTSMGYALMVFNTCSDLILEDHISRGEASVFSLIPYDEIDVVILYEEKLKSKFVFDSLKEKAFERNIPVIVIGKQHEKCTNIEFDYELGFKKVVEHVIDEHKPASVHFMGGFKDNEFSNTRLECFRKVLESRNIPFDMSMVSYGDFWTIPAENATKKLVEENRVPEAIVCANDAMAFAVMGVLKDAGYSIPKDVIVTGFDGIDDIYFSNPKLTSCMCSYAELANRIADILPLCEEGKLKSETILVSPTPILSASCGCVDNSGFDAVAFRNAFENPLYRYFGEDRILSEMSARIQSCTNINQVCEKLAHEVNFDMSIILKQECIDSSVNPTVIRDNSLGEKVCVVFDSDHADVPVPYDMPSENIIPNMVSYFDMGCALIFTALNFLDVPMGYICFHYHKYYIENYYKIPQTTSALNNAIGGFRNMRYQHHLWTQIEAMYMRDALTGLYNRRGFAKAYRNLVDNTDGLVTVVLADLDGLKFINDNYGHGEGDVAISTVAAALRYGCPPSAVCVRFGGDELLAVIAGDCDENAIRSSIDSFIRARNEEYQKPYEISASIGIYASQKTDELDFEELIKTSDKLMYAEKQAKKKLREEKKNFNM